MSYKKKPLVHVTFFTLIMPFPSLKKKKIKKKKETEIITVMSDIAYTASKNTCTSHIPLAHKF